jgi:hypothetical protein
MVVCMGGLQVFVVRFFFQVSVSPWLQTAAWDVSDRLTGRSQGLRVNDLCKTAWALFDTAKMA